MTSSEVAAWVQAIGSILAIGGAVAAALWQARVQHRNALRQLALTHKNTELGVAKALFVLATNCTKTVSFISKQLHGREQVYNVAEGVTHVDRGQIGRLDGALAGIPLHSLPSTLISHAMILAATVRQYGEKLDQVMKIHRTMDADDFSGFFNDIADAEKNLKDVSSDISIEIEKIERGG